MILLGSSHSTDGDLLPVNDLRVRFLRLWSRQTHDMNAWLTVVAALAGGLIALAGQFITGRTESKRERRRQLLESCAVVVSLSEDFRNRVWEERTLGKTGRVDEWDLGRSRMAENQLLCDDPHVLAALEGLRTAGRDLGSYWRRGMIDEAHLDVLYEGIKEARRQGGKEWVRRFGQAIVPIVVVAWSGYRVRFLEQSLALWCSLQYPRNEGSHFISTDTLFHLEPYRRKAISSQVQYATTGIARHRLY